MGLTTYQLVQDFSTTHSNYQSSSKLVIMWHPPILNTSPVANDLRLADRVSCQQHSNANKRSRLTCRQWHVVAGLFFHIFWANGSHEKWEIDHQSWEVHHQDWTKPFEGGSSGQWYPKISLICTRIYIYRYIDMSTCIDVYIYLHCYIQIDVLHI